MDNHNRKLVLLEMAEAVFPRGRKMMVFEDGRPDRDGNTGFRVCFKEQGVYTDAELSELAYQIAGLDLAVDWQALSKNMDDIIRLRYVPRAVILKTKIHLNPRCVDKGTGEFSPLKGKH